MANEGTRAASREGQAASFEQSYRSLLTYRYLGKANPNLDKGAERELMRLRRDMRNSTGGVMAAPLCIASVEPWWLDDQGIAAQVAPVTMTYDIVDPAHDVRRIEVLRDVIGVGRKMGFSRARVVDADHPDRVIGISTGSGVDLGVVPPGFEPIDNAVHELEDAPDLPPLRDVFGVRAGDDASLVIDEVTPELGSPNGALHQGPVNIVLEAAAMDELERVTGTADLQVEHWTVLFVKPGYAGPFRATASVVGGAGAVRWGVEATLTDEGNGNRTVATASSSFGRVGP